ncbi:MAG TPA: transposase [Chlamydiales bacterium]|nr:transposase [Chlamydiales bacterium]
MTTQARVYVSAETKIEILKKVMMQGCKISDLCEEYGIKPSSVYQWQNELFSRGQSLFEVKRGPKFKDKSQEKIEALEAKLKKRDNCIAELLQDHCALKKSLGMD